MGMYDNVKCERPLPGPLHPKYSEWLQSKDMHCEMDTYTITADGRLVGPHGWLPEYHGVLNFYTYEGGGEPGTFGMWFEYEAKFTDGNLQGIKCVEIARCPHGQPKVVLYPESTAPDADAGQ